MRVALVVTGGVDRSGRDRVIPALLALIERLARRHHVVVYVLRYLDQATTYPLLGATIRDLGRPRGVVRQYSALVKAMADDGPFDLVHGYWALPAGLVATLAGRRLGVPSVVTCDSGEFVALPEIGYGARCWWRQRIAVTVAARLAHRVSVCTNYQAALAQSHAVRPEVIPLGVDPARFVPVPRADGPPWRLLHVGSVNPVKDHETLLRAHRALVDRGLDVHLDIVGENTMGDTVPALSVALGIADRVTFHGFIPTDALAPFYQRAHLFVLTSRHEAAGVVVLEASCCGVPVVGTAVGYVADWAPQRAVAVPTTDPQALARAIETLLAQPAERVRLASAARDWTLAHDADWSTAQFERLYAQCGQTTGANPF